MGIFLESFFSDGDHARVFVMVLVVVVVAIGIWVGRKKLGVAVPFAVLVVLLAAVILPSWDPGRRVACQNECQNNLRVIERAKAKWAEAGNRQPNDVSRMNELFGSELEFRHEPVCPTGGTYSVGAVGEMPRFSWAAKGHKLE